MESIRIGQAKMIGFYRDKWREIALQTGQINRPKAGKIIKDIYNLIGKKEPDILFFDSIESVFERFVQIPVATRLNYQLERQLQMELYEQLYSETIRQLGIELVTELQSKLYSDYQLVIPMHRQLRSQLGREETDKPVKKMGSHLRRSWSKCLQPEALFEYVSLLDFCTSVLNCSYDRRRWELLQSLVEYCGWTYTFDGICLMCDRPIKLSFDHQNRLHAEGEPAIEFADGYSLYSYHGVTLPEKYGKLHPHQWQVKWLLEEDNATIRRVLIQGIGYGRISQELPTIEVDSYQEYTLLKIDYSLDFEPMYLLKMTCPSTGYMHVLRVPPIMRSAREAICWVNWGTAPEEFLMQS